MTERPSQESPTTAPPPSGVPPGLTTLADHWGLVLAYGIVTVGLGVVLAVWPDETLVVVAVLIAIQLIVTGVLRIGMAIAASSLDGGVRALIGLTGALALIVGLLCLRDPLQTLLVIGLILGVWWVVAGLVDIIGAILSPGTERRLWDVAMGVVSVLAGGFLLVKPDLSLTLLVVVICAWLFAYGFFAIVAAFSLRSTRGAPLGAQQMPASPAT